MRPWPNAQFWRLWLTARALCIVGCSVLVGLGSAHAETWRTSYYGAESGRFNADGSRFLPMGMTAAHRSLAFGTRLQVCYRACTIVTVRDRGPALRTGRTLDLAHGAALAIGLEAAGVANVAVQILGRR